MSKKYKETYESVKADKSITQAKKMHFKGKKSPQYSDQLAMEIFKNILARGYLSPTPLVWTALFQATFSESWEYHSQHIDKVGNYYLYKMDKAVIPKDLVIYSFGIGNNIAFDIDLYNKFDIAIHMFDPTPKVEEFMNKYKTQKGLVYHKIGVVNTCNGNCKFYQTGNEDKINSSLYDIGYQNLYTEVPFKTLETIMMENKHNRIDILKLDIEGVARGVLNQMFDETEIRPLQILAEFEIVSVDDPLVLLPQISDLMKKMKDNNYTIFNINLLRKATIEILAVKNYLLRETW